MSATDDAGQDCWAAASGDGTRVSREAVDTTTGGTERPDHEDDAGRISGLHAKGVALNDALAALRTPVEQQTDRIKRLVESAETLTRRVSELHAFLDVDDESHHARGVTQRFDVFGPQPERIAGDPADPTHALHSEIAKRDRVVASRDVTIEMLHQEVQARDLILAARDEAIGHLRREIVARDTILAARDEAIRYLQREVSGRDAVVAARDESIAFLQREIQARDIMLTARDRALVDVQAEVGAQQAIIDNRDDAIAFLQAEIHAREAILAARDEAIEALRHEVEVLELGP
jgi:chromosome segregation ATPase